MQGEDISLFDQLIQRAVGDVQSRFFLFAKAYAIMIDDLRIESLYPPGHRATDSAKSDNAHSLATQRTRFGTHFRLDPPAGADRLVQISETAIDSQNQKHNHLSHRVCVHTAGDGHAHTAVPGRLNVDFVIARTEFLYKAQISTLEHPGRNRRPAGQDNV